MKIKIPKKPDASDRRIGDLIFEARQRKSWSDYFRNQGKPAVAETQYKKYLAAKKALESLGYDTTNLFDY